MAQILPRTDLLLSSVAQLSEALHRIVSSALRRRVSVRLCTGTDLQVCGEPVGVGHG